MPYRVLDDANSDGVVLGQSIAAKVGLYGGPAIPQRSVPMQANIQGLGSGMLSTSVLSFTPAAVGANTCVEQLFAISPTTGVFCETSTDFVLCVNKPTANAGVGIIGTRISATNQVAMNFNNVSTASIQPTQPENYQTVIAHGVPIITQNWKPTAVASMTTSEQIVSVMGSGAAGTAIINSAGQVVGVNITSGGSGYFYPPAIVLGGGVPLGGLNTPVGGSGPTTAANLGIIGGSPFSAVVAPGASDVSGTYTGLNYPAATAATPYGSGATAIAVVSGGAVVGAVITASGSGYQVAPSVSFTGGNLFSMGMMAHVNKSAPDYYVAASSVPEAKITQSSLFPWVKTVKPLEYESYTVYAGDCEANNPVTVTASGEKLTYHAPVTVTPGGSTTDKVEVPAVNVEVFEGTKAKPLSALASAEYAYITNEACKATTSQNGAVTYQHKVALTAGGKLESKYKYQPYAKELVLCVTAYTPIVGKESEKKYFRNTFKIENAKKAGTGTYKFYLQELKNTEDSGKEENATAGKLKCP